MAPKRQRAHTHACEAFRGFSFFPNSISVLQLMLDVMYCDRSNYSYSITPTSHHYDPRLMYCNMPVSLSEKEPGFKCHGRGWRCFPANSLRTRFWQADNQRVPAPWLVAGGNRLDARRVKKGENENGKGKPIHKTSTRRIFRLIDWEARLQNTKNQSLLLNCFMSVRLCCFDNLWRLHAHACTHTHRVYNQSNWSTNRQSEGWHLQPCSSQCWYLCVCVCVCVCVLCHYDAESGHNVEGFMGKAEKMSTRDIKHGRRFLALYSWQASPVSRSIFSSLSLV